jgi:uncharacterized membrane protein
MAQPRPDEDGISDGRVGYTLLGGLWLSVLVMIAGLVLAASEGIHQADRVTPLQHVFGDLGAGRPGAVLSLGILLLFATPFAGVLVAMFEFIRRRDGPFVWITATLLVILLIGFAVALR